MYLPKPNLMKAKFTKPAEAALLSPSPPGKSETDRIEQLAHQLKKELEAELNLSGATIARVAHRIATEVDRICSKSDRIQASGQVNSWQLTLGRYRIEKCVRFYQLGSQRGRVELHSNLSTMVYRPIAPAHLQLTFQARYTLIEDFLQGFYTEALRAFRRENEFSDSYQPRTRVELAEYMAFTEQYAKRRITLPTRQNQQLIILRAQRFASRQPQEIAVDIETAMETAKADEMESYGRSGVLQMIREQMVSERADPTESALRDRVVLELMRYLESQGQKDCVDYLTLKLQDLSVSEIDEILGLTPRKRDYLQQRFKYHVEKFTTSNNWKLVHEWLGADLDQNLGLSPNQWEAFLNELSDEQEHLLQLKRSGASDQEILAMLKCTSKQLQKRWAALLDLARQQRNQTK